MKAEYKLAILSIVAVVISITGIVLIALKPEPSYTGITICAAFALWFTWVAIGAIRLGRKLSPRVRRR